MVVGNSKYMKGLISTGRGFESHPSFLEVLLYIVSETTVYVCCLATLLSLSLFVLMMD